MIITADEYREMGFTAEDSDTLEKCLKRAEYTLYGLTEGRVDNALAAGGKAAEYVKQAAGFQTQKLVMEEQAQSSRSGASEKVTIGDYSYSSSTESGASDYSASAYDMSMQAISLLKAAGCIFGGREVRG